MISNAHGGSTWEAEMGLLSRVQGQPWLHSKFEANVSSVRYCLVEQTKKQGVDGQGLTTAIPSSVEAVCRTRRPLNIS